MQNNSNQPKRATFGVLVATFPNLLAALLYDLSRQVSTWLINLHTPFTRGVGENLGILIVIGAFLYDTLFFLYSRFGHFLFGRKRPIFRFSWHSLLWWHKVSIFLLIPFILAALFTVQFVLPVHQWLFPQESDIGIDESTSAHIGICDGHCAFDLDRLDGDLKREAQDALNRGQTMTACAYWQMATSYDPSDAEANIYHDNYCLDNAGKYSPETFIVVAPLAGKDAIHIGRDILQGAYIQQKEYNQQHPGDTRMFLLIANMGDNLAGDQDAQHRLASQLIRAIDHANNHVIGIAGLPFGSDTLIDDLGGECVPIASIAPLEEGKHIDCFHSVAPSLADQANAAVSYVQTVLHPSRIGIIYSSQDPYSDALQKAFTQVLYATVSPGEVAPSRIYTEGDGTSIQGIAEEMQQDHVDLVYFTGPAPDAALLQSDLGQSVHVMGADRIYQFIHSAPPSDSTFDHLLFTSFAFNDQPGIEGIKNAPFFQDFSATYNPDSSHSGSLYNFSRADDENMLSYDALSLLATASKGFFQDKKDLSWQKLNDALGQYAPNAGNDFGGLSGQISYQPGASIPYKKAVLVLQIQDGKTHSLGVWSGTYCQQRRTNQASSGCY